MWNINKKEESILIIKRKKDIIGSLYSSIKHQMAENYAEE